MKKTIVCISLLFICFNCWSQVPEAKPIKRMSIKHYYFQTGLLRPYNNIGSLADFRALAPDSDLLNSDLSGFNEYGSFRSGSNSGLSFLVGIQFSDKEKTRYKPNPLLRLGVSFFSESVLSNGYSNQQRTPFDTLVSSLTGQEYLVDSIVDQNYSMTYWSQQLRLDGSFIFRTNPEARLSLFTGIGFTAGFSVMAQTDVYSSTFTTIQAKFPGGSTANLRENNGSNSSQLEGYVNKTNFGASAYVPMGFNFRLGNKNEFLKRIFLNYEFRPGLNFTSIPELGNYTNVLTQHNFGIRVSWN